MVRSLMLLALFALFSVPAQAYISTKDFFISDIPQVYEWIVPIIACEEAHIALSLYWEAVEGDEGGYYSRFLRNELTSCQSVRIIVPQDLYRACRTNVEEQCGAFEVLLNNGNIKYGVLLPTFDN